MNTPPPNTRIDAFMERHEHLTGDSRMDRLHEEFHVLLQALREAPLEAAADALLALITQTRDHFDQEDTCLCPISELHPARRARCLRPLSFLFEGGKAGTSRYPLCFSGGKDQRKDCERRPH